MYDNEETEADAPYRMCQDAEQELLALRCKPAICQPSELDVRWQELVRSRDNMLNRAQGAEARVAELERERDDAWLVMLEGGKIVRCSDIVTQAKGTELYIRSLEEQRDAYKSEAEKNRNAAKPLARALRTLVDCIEDSTFQDGVFREAKYERTTVCTAGDLDEAKAALKEIQQ